MGNKIGFSPDFPVLAQFKEFLSGRICALDNMEATSRSVPKPGSALRPAKVNMVVQLSDTASNSPSTSYPCYLCEKAQFIAFCGKFKSLTALARREFITRNRLCFCCFGRHGVRDCKTPRRCSSCRG